MLPGEIYVDRYLRICRFRCHSIIIQKETELDSRFGNSVISRLYMRCKFSYKFDIFDPTLLQSLKGEIF